jgi:hypothetical protein
MHARHAYADGRVVRTRSEVGMALTDLASAEVLLQQCVLLLRDAQRALLPDGGEDAGDVERAAHVRITAIVDAQVPEVLALIRNELERERE